MKRLALLISASAVCLTVLSCTTVQSERVTQQQTNALSNTTDTASSMTPAPEPKPERESPQLSDPVTPSGHESPQPTPPCDPPQPPNWSMPPKDVELELIPTEGSLDFVTLIPSPSLAKKECKESFLFFVNTDVPPATIVFEDAAVHCHNSERLYGEGAAMTHHHILEFNFTLSGAIEKGVATVNLEGDASSKQYVSDVEPPPEIPEPFTEDTPFEVVMPLTHDCEFKLGNEEPCVIATSEEQIQQGTDWKLYFNSDICDQIDVLLEKIEELRQEKETLGKLYWDKAPEATSLKHLEQLVKEAFKKQGTGETKGYELGDLAEYNPCVPNPTVEFNYDPCTVSLRPLCQWEKAGTMIHEQFHHADATANPARRDTFCTGSEADAAKIRACWEKRAFEVEAKFYQEARDFLEGYYQIEYPKCFE